MSRTADDPAPTVRGLTSTSDPRATGRQLPGPLAARTIGERGPLVVALHGLAESGRYWRPAIGALTRDHRVVVIDLLGFGRSPRPDLGYSAQSHADAVAATLRAAGLADEPAILLAHQAGVTVAVNHARRRPGAVRAIVGLGTPWFRSPGEARRALRGPWWMSRWLVEHTDRAQFLCRTVCGGRRPLVPRVARWFAPGDVPGEVVEDAFLHSWRSFSQTLDSCIVHASLTDLVAADFPVPTLLLHGEEDTLVPIDNLLDARSSRPGISVRGVPGRGHNLVWTDPELVADAVAALAAQTATLSVQNHRPEEHGSPVVGRPGRRWAVPAAVLPQSEHTVADAARLLRVSRRTVQTWVELERVHWRRSEGRLLIERASLLEHAFGSAEAASHLLATSWLTAAEAAARLGVGHATVARQVAAGRIPSHRVAGRRVFLATELDAVSGPGNSPG